MNMIEVIGMFSHDTSPNAVITAITGDITAAPTSRPRDWRSCRVNWPEMND